MVKLQDMVNLYVIMVIYTKVNGKMIYIMEKAKKFMKMEINLVEILSKDKEMGMDYLNGMIKHIMRVNFLIMLCKGKVNMYGVMEENIVVNGKIML